MNRKENTEHLRHLIALSESRRRVPAQGLHPFYKAMYDKLCDQGFLDLYEGRYTINAKGLRFVDEIHQLYELVKKHGVG